MMFFIKAMVENYVTWMVPFWNNLN